MPRANLTLYWQHGCTSCLRVREFLVEHGLAFESINVAESPTARQALMTLGARSIPVLVCGRDWIHGQDIDELARFVGITLVRHPIEPTELISRLDYFLVTAIQLTQHIPDGLLEVELPARADRTTADLAAHIAWIVRGFLIASLGGELEFRHFEMQPKGTERTIQGLTEILQQTQQDLYLWWQDAESSPPPTVVTYYGIQTLHSVLERTAWHVAQHCRQLEWVLRNANVALPQTISATALAQLPLPTGIWDREKSN